MALTFDACPTTHKPPFSPEIVDVLVHENVAATFFVSGRWAETHPNEFHRLAGVPFFGIALHGYWHRKVAGASADAIFAEIDAGRAALRQLGVEPQPLFRPPFGDHPVMLAASAARAGVVPVLWDVVSGDPDPTLAPTALMRKVLGTVKGGSIVVMHVNGRGIASAAALPALIAALRARGFRFVTVLELLDECGTTIPAGGSEEGAK